MTKWPFCLGLNVLKSSWIVLSVYSISYEWGELLRFCSVADIENPCRHDIVAPGQ